jgi:hypothetical protein
LKRAGKEEENKGGTTNCSWSSWFDVLSAKNNALVSSVSHSQNKYTGRTPVWSWSPGNKSWLAEENKKKVYNDIGQQLILVDHTIEMT